MNLTSKDGELTSPTPPSPPPDKHSDGDSDHSQSDNRSKLIENKEFDNELLNHRNSYDLS